MEGPWEPWDTKVSRDPNPRRRQGGKNRDRGKGWGPSVWEREKHVCTKPGRNWGDWGSGTPHLSHLLSSTQMIRSGSEPETLQVHPGLAWQSLLPSLLPTCPLQEGAKGKRREEEKERIQRGRDRERK